MKIGIMSDLHMSSYDPWDFVPEKDVFYICAGDISEDYIFRNNWARSHSSHMFAILGNHDYYGSTFQYAHEHTKETEINGLKIAGATLWTDLSNNLDWVMYVRGLIDMRMIRDMNQNDMCLTHNKHKEFLFNSNADIIVSHHAPSKKSIHPRYVNNPLNRCFANDLEEMILSMETPPKLWVHGHTHDRFDYFIGNTRVVCYPRGYSGELKDYDKYTPYIIEV